MASPMDSTPANSTFAIFSTAPAKSVGMIGGLREFAVQNDFTVWYEQFEQHVEANDISIIRFVPLFLTLLDIDGHKLLRNLCAPNRPKNKSLDELVYILSSHLKNRVSSRNVLTLKIASNSLRNRLVRT